MHNITVGLYQGMNSLKIFLKHFKSSLWQFTRSSRNVVKKSGCFSIVYYKMHLLSKQKNYTTEY